MSSSESSQRAERPEAVALRSSTFRLEREKTWRELEAVLDLADRRGTRRLTDSQLARLPILYRFATSSLSVARATSLDANLRAYLEALVARAYLRVYGPRPRYVEAILGFLRGFPVEIRRIRISFALSTATMFAGWLLAFVLVMQDSANYYSIMPDAMVQGREPASSTAELRSKLYSGDEHAGEDLAQFAASLFSNNSQVAMLSFALGFLIGVPTLLLIFYNGLVLGAFTALHHERGLGLDVWGWLLPHGVTELLAIILCGAAGLALGGSVLFPGEASRRRNLIRCGRQVSTVVLGSILMMLMAGLIEGIFRQRVQDVGIRYAVVAASFIFWGLYIGCVGRARR